MLPGLHVCRRRGGLPVLTPPAQTSDGDGYSVSAVFPCVFWTNAAGDGAPDHVDTVGFLEARQQSPKRKKWIGPPAQTAPRLQRLGPSQLNPEPIPSPAGLSNWTSIICSGVAVLELTRDM